MPSGHAETITIFSLLLYFYKFIPLWLAIIFIIMVSLQRVFTKMHTFIQVAIGAIIGYIYAMIYKYFGLNNTAIFIVFSIGILLAALSINKLDKQIYGPIPSWVSPEMIKSIKSKQDSPFYIKIGSIYANAIIQNRTFISWKQLENYMDTIIENIKNTNVQYDGVVGIKTGGAILSDYISFKLGLPNYKVKVSRSVYNCKKQSYNVINDLFEKSILGNYGNMQICEDINDNLEGKNLILIDEQVTSGKTMIETINYLIFSKNVNTVYPVVISLYKKKYKGKTYINHIISGAVLIWSWGYDN
jgi:hypoxanthine phosphoribosyltransferase